MSMDTNLIPILCLGGMLIGVLFSMFYPKGDRRRTRATYVFIFSASILFATWLLNEQKLVNTLRENTRMGLFGLGNDFC